MDRRIELDDDYCGGNGTVHGQPSVVAERSLTLEMTMDLYGHVTLDDKREALEKVGNLFEEDSK